ncbi:hypothetical protein CXF59_13275 [Flavobacterium sp. ALD4]|uniref:hypothetical protein n=1 Tax=Flavobacterium sp. ALD4 TaxID=2058314 RepID=UPI000C32FB1A|nr:hypothetical protein [Flavobacterium sp. ALD4]PKH66882.1 hypothetical protein CXF59_13275 [Flavobacterium sp. ALD4]
MATKSFREKTIANKASDNWCSINNGVKYYAFILVDYKPCWESFYFDEKGGINNLNLFSNEDEVLDYL